MTRPGLDSRSCRWPALVPCGRRRRSSLRAPRRESARHNCHRSCVRHGSRHDGCRSVAIAATTTVVDEMRTAMAARFVAGPDRRRRGSTPCGAATAVALRFESVRRRLCLRAGRRWQRQRRTHGRNSARASIDRWGRPSVCATSFPECASSWRRGCRTPTARLSPADGVRIGSSRLLTMSADGTATSGTLYIRGRRGQYAVRVLGATGRTRMLQYWQGTAYGSAVNRPSGRHALRPAGDRGHARRFCGQAMRCRSSTSAPAVR